MNQWGSDAFAGADLAGFGGNPSTLQRSTDMRYGGAGQGAVTADELHGGWLVPAPAKNSGAERVSAGGDSVVRACRLLVCCRSCLLITWEQERGVCRKSGVCRSDTALSGVEAIVREASERWQGGLEDPETRQCVVDLLQKRVALAEVQLLSVMSGRVEQGQGRNEPFSSRG
jgi:hypothetical protein